MSGEEVSGLRCPAVGQHLSGFVVGFTLVADTLAADRRIDTIPLPRFLSQSVSGEGDVVVHRVGQGIGSSLYASALKGADCDSGDFPLLPESGSPLYVDSTSIFAAEVASGHAMPSSTRAVSSSTVSREPANMNAGSYFHPELCSRPCLYFSSGTCVNGQSCGFCHLPHSRRVTNLDKEHREALRNMTLPEWTELVLPIMSNRIDSFTDTADARQAFSALASACGMTVEQLTRCHPHRGLRLLIFVLKSLRLRTLLREAVLYLGQHNPEARSAAENLLLVLQRRTPQ